MNLPEMKYADRIRKRKQIQFAGLNMAVGAKDGELTDMWNLTSDHSPVLSPRAKRMLYMGGQLFPDPGGIFSSSRGLYWVADGKFYCDGVERGAVTKTPKVFARMGSNIVIFPDKKYYNEVTKEFLSLESVWRGSSLTFGHGKRYGEAAHANAVSCDGVKWENYFREGDAVTIRGCRIYPDNNGTAIIRQIEGDKLYFSENLFTLTEADEAYTENGGLFIERYVPNLEHVCEHDNRLWGCDGDTIYASKLGDIFNWYVYDGLDTDSWAWTPGSVGEFTGAISYRGHMMFFKEDYIYKVYGTAPSNFQAVGSASLGVAPGSEKSLAIANETLFYLSRSGIVAYTGGVPQPIGQAFGPEKFRKAVAGSDGLKYYVSMRNAAGVPALYVFDTLRGMWHKEDWTEMVGFTNWNGNLLFQNKAGSIGITGNIQYPPENFAYEEAVSWFAVFADFTEDDPNKKGISKLQIRLELMPESHLDIYIKYDGNDNDLHLVKTIRSGGHKRSFYIPLIPRRCDHYSLELHGVGDCKVYSIVRETYSGSEQ